MDIKYGGFWVRFAASLIDSLWVTVLTYGPIIFVAFNDLMDPDDTAYVVFYTFCMFVLPGIVSVILWSLFQSTPGKLAVGLVVVDATTLRPASVLKYSLRYVGYYVAMIPLFLGYVWIAFDKRKRGLHDYIGGTVVVFKSSLPEAPEDAYAPGEPVSNT